MGGRLDPAVARVRLAVRRALDGVADAQVSVACSGGPDSLALAAAVAFEARTRGWRLSAVVVDHGLQAGSADVAARAADQLRGLGYADVDVRRVEVDLAGGDGPEGAARAARRRAYVEHAVERRGCLLLTGHTRDDLAEQVLLGLARGSGPRSVAGIAPRSSLAGDVVELVRPLLDVPRADTLAACAAQGLEVWHDPHNADPTYARVRVRERVLPVLEADLGPGVAEALARTAALARDDADLLDALAKQAYEASLVLSAETLGLREDRLEAEGRVGFVTYLPPPLIDLDTDELARLAPALLSRVLRRAAIDAGAIESELTYAHVREVARLVTDWHGQGPIPLPGHVSATRTPSRIRVRQRHHTA